MLAFIFTFSLIFLLLIALYLLYFLILKPLIGIRFYKSQGIKMSFFPLLGTVKDCLNALATTDDFYGHWKRQAKQDPNLQAVGGNFLDRPHIFLIEPKLIKEFFRNQENYIKVPSINDLMRVTSHDGLVSAEGELWKRHRKIVSSAFRFEILKEMVPEIVKISDQFIEDFKNLDMNRVDLSEEFQTIAGEVVGRLFFGVEFHDYRIQGKPAIAFLNDLSYRIGEQGFTLAYLIFGIKTIEWGFLPKYVKIRRDTKEFRGVIADIIEDKKAQANKKDPKQPSNSPLTFLDVLLSQDVINTEQSFSTEEMMNEFVTLVGAGSVTTGETLSRGLYYLHKNPQYKADLMEEVNKYFKDPSKVSLEDLNQMEFMTAFTKEVLRFFPNQIGVFDRETIKDHNLGDLRVKKGTIINVAGLCNNFNPLYHDCEDEFSPERWLKNSKTKESVTKDPLLYIPFSAGPRSCIGQQLAMAEIKVMLSLFLKKYDFELDPNYKLRTTMRIGYGPLEVMYFKLIPK